MAPPAAVVQAHPRKLRLRPPLLLVLLLDLARRTSAETKPHPLVSFP